MAEEFKVKIGAELDSTSFDNIKNQLNTLQDNTHRVRIDLDATRVQRQINSIRRQIENLGRIRINLGGDIGSGRRNGGLGGVQRTVTQTQEAYNDLMNLARRINSIRLQIGGLDSSKNSNQIAELSGQLNSLMTTYNNLYNTFTRGLDLNQLNVLENEINSVNAELERLRASEQLASRKGIDTSTTRANIQSLEVELSELIATYHRFSNGLSMGQIDNLTNTFQNTTDKVSVLNAKIADMRANLANSINIKLETGDFDNQFKTLEGNFNKLTLKSSDVRDGVKEVETALKEMRTASENGDTDGLINAQQRFEAALKKTSNQISINIKEQKELADTQKLLNNKNNLSLQMDVWLKNNSAAAKQFGERLRQLQSELKSCDGVRFTGIKSEFEQIKKQAALAGKATQSFSDKFKKEFSKLSTYFSASAVILQTTRALKSMYDNVVKIDTALTELKKVTNETDSAYDSFLKNAGEDAKEIGTTIDGLVSSTADFARLGHGFTESQELAKVANIYAVVGDEIADVNEATEHLVSTTAAYGDEVDAMNIIDKFNEVGNNFAISSGGIGEALERSASSMKAANNTLDETIALITAANTVVQDADVVGTAFKTISMRIRGAETELEEAGLDADGMAESTAKLREEIMALSGVDIMINDDEFKSTYQIMEELANKWGELTDIQQASITELIAGKRQGNIVSSLMENFDIAEKALQTSLNSSGSAMTEHAKWMESLDAKLQRLQASWQSLSQSFLDSDFLKVLVDGLTNVISLLDKIVQTFGTLGTISIGTGIVAFIKNFESLKNLGNVFNIFGGASSGLKGLQGIKEHIKNLNEVKTLLNSLGGTSFANVNQIASTLKILGNLGETSVGVDTIKNLSSVMNTFDGSEGAINNVVDAISGLSKESKIAVLSMFDLSEAEAKNILMATGLAEAEATATATTIASGTAAKGASVGFAAFATSVKTAAAGLWAFLTTNPIGWAILAGTAIFGAVKVFDALTESFDEAKEKAEESRQAYESTASEVESLNSELKTTQDRINELKSKGSLTVTEQEELAKLEAQNKQLEYQLAIKKKLAQYQQGEAAKDANNVLTKKQSYKTDVVSDYHGDTPVYYKTGDIIDETSDKQKELNQKEQEYIDLLEKQSKTDVGTLDFKQNEKAIEKVKGEIDTLNSDISTNLNEINTQYDSLFDTDGNVIEGYEDTASRIESLYDSVLSSSNDATDAANGTSEAIEDTATSVDTLSKSVETMVAYQEALSSAMESSKSATGLTSEQVETLTSAYKDLEGFDANKLFEKTTNGIHLNEEALKELNAQYEAQKELEFAEKLKDLGNQYDDVTEKIKNCKEGSEEYDALLAEKSSIESEIQQVSLLASEYAGLTSNYNKWLQAKNGGNERDSYESVGSGYEEMEKIVDNGWYGDESLNAYLDLLLSAKERTGNAQKDFAKLDKTIEGTSHSLMDYWKYDEDTDELTTDGLFDFLDDVNAVFGDSYAKITEDGKYAFDFTGDRLDEVASRFGTTTDVVSLFAQALIDAGMAVDLSDSSYIDDIGTLEEKIKSTEEALKKLNSEPVDINIDVKGDEIEIELEKAKSKIEEIKNSDLEPEIKTAKLEDAYAKVDLLVAKLNQPTFMELDISSVDSELQDALTALQEYQTAVNNLNALKIKGASTEEIEKAKSKVDELAGKIKELPEETKTKIGIDAEDGIENIKSKIADDKIKINVDADTSNAKTEIADIEGEKVTVDVTTSGNEAIDNLKSAIEGIKDKTVKIRADVSEALTTINNFINKQFFGKVKWSNDKSEVDSYSLEEKEANGTVKWKNDESAVDNFKDKIHKATGIVYWENNTEKVRTSFTASGTVKWDDEFAKGTAHSKGTAFVGGTAFARGNWGTKESGIALGGELGQELVVRNGKFFTIGDDGAEFFKYQKNDIIFNASQTASLFKYGGIKGANPRGKVFASGTAFVEGNAFPNGSNGSRRPDSGENTYSPPTKTTKNKNKNKNKTDTDEFEESFDWIEVMINRIERTIDRLDKNVNRTYKSWTSRNNNLKSELNAVRDEMEIQSAGYDRYMQEANSVGLSKKWRKKVQNGTIDISTITNENLAEKIQDYQTWYEKALACKDALLELKDTEAELYMQAFDNIVTKYDGMLSQYDYQKNMLEEHINQSEAKGHIVSTKYYDSLIKTEKSNKSKLESERTALIASLKEAVDSGVIVEGSEDWRTMVNQINDVTLAIEESETALIEYNNSLRQIEWDTFDLKQKEISRVTDESDYLIDLMSNDKLYDDKGKLTNEGMATMGLHGLNYNVYMEQADEYAKEMEEINKDLAKDPYNQDLINRKQELIEKQRESVLAAEDEKQAIIDMVKEGIDLELDSLQNLIDKYKEALDAEKDLYDYQKNVKEQTEEIASLQKQLSAYAGDSSEEAKAKVQQLQVSLADAEEKLEETEYEKYISDQKQLLDELYTEYETILNQRLDNTDALLADMITGINNNASTISTTLTTEAGNVGTTLSTAMKSIWDTGEGNAKSVLQMYGEKITGKETTTVKSTLDGIKTGIDNMISALDTDAKKEINKDKTTANENKGKGGKDKNKDKDKDKDKDKNKDKDKDKNTNKTNFFIKKKDSYPKSKLNKNTSIIDRLKYHDYDSSFSARKKYYSKMGFKGTYTSSYKQNVNMLDWMKKNGYKDGKYRLSKDELAWTQENGMEAIIRPSDGAILTPLAQDDSVLKASATSNLFNFANDPSSFIRDNLNAENFVATTPSQNVGGNTYDNDFSIQIELPNVMNYEQFKYAMQHDKNFEKMVRAMTVDKMFGGSSLKKYKY